MPEQLTNVEQSKAHSRIVSSTDDHIRANTYSLLASLLAGPPSAELLELLRKIDAPAANGNSGMAVVWRTLKLAAERATVEQLDDEYHELFIGVGRGELMPYGSWYLVGFMMDKPLALLRQDLAVLGFERQQGVYETEDHVAALCETMSMIIGSQEEISFERQRKFFDDHIGLWMSKFFNDLHNAKSARFYRTVGQLGAQFMEIEKQYLSMLV